MPEIISELKKRKIDIIIVTETQKKAKGTEEIDDYIFIYSGVEEEKGAAAGVGIILRKRLKSRIIRYSWISERITTIKIKTGRSHCYIIGAYAPVEGKAEKTETFYEQLQESLNTAGRNDYIIVAGDLNARIGNIATPKLIGPHGERIINTNGKQLRDFCMYDNLRITNTYHPHKDILKYTWTERGNRSIIDYIIANEKIWSYVLDSRSYRGAEVDTDHYLLCSKIRKPNKYWKKAKITKLDKAEKYKIQLLEQPSIRHSYKMRLDTHIKGRTGDINQDWTSLKTIITKTAKEVSGLQSKRKPSRLKIWNETLKEAIKARKKLTLDG
jgi:hypothetical protein